MAKDLLDQNAYDYSDITFQEGATKRAVARVKYRQGKCLVIEFSKYLFPCLHEEHAIDTIRHEVAHILVGSGNGHNNIWKNKFLELGGSGRATSSSTEFDEKRLKEVMKKNWKWTYYCTSCDFEVGRARRLNKGSRGSCPRCCPGRFNDKYLLKVKQNY